MSAAFIGKDEPSSRRSSLARPRNAAPLPPRGGKVPIKAAASPQVRFLGKGELPSSSKLLWMEWNRGACLGSQDDLSRCGPMWAQRHRPWDERGRPLTAFQRCGTRQESPEGSCPLITSASRRRSCPVRCHGEARAACRDNTTPRQMHGCVPSARYLRGGGGLRESPNAFLRHGTEP